MGNYDDIDLMAMHACSLLDMCGRTDVPVVKGAASPIASEYSGQNGAKIHGETGIGNVMLPPTQQMALQDVTAAEFIVKHCQDNEGEITLVTLGPLTNIVKFYSCCCCC